MASKKLKAKQRFYEDQARDGKITQDQAVSMGAKYVAPVKPIFSAPKTVTQPSNTQTLTPQQQSQADQFIANKLGGQLQANPFQNLKSQAPQSNLSPQDQAQADAFITKLKGAPVQQSSPAADLQNKMSQIAVQQQNQTVAPEPSFFDKIRNFTTSKVGQLQAAIKESPFIKEVPGETTAQASERRSKLVAPYYTDPNKMAEGVDFLASNALPSATKFVKTTGNIIGEGADVALDKSGQVLFGGKPAKAFNEQNYPYLFKASLGDLGKQTAGAMFDATVAKLIPSSYGKNIVARLGLGAVQSGLFAISDGIANGKSLEQIKQEAKDNAPTFAAMEALMPYVGAFFSQNKSIAGQLKKDYEGVASGISKLTEGVGGIGETALQPTLAGAVKNPFSENKVGEVNKNKVSEIVNGKPKVAPKESPLIQEANKESVEKIVPKESSLPTQLGKEDKTIPLSQDQRVPSSTLAAEKQSEKATLSAGVEKGTGIKGENSSYAEKLAQTSKDVNTGNRAVDYYTQGRDKITPMPDRVDAPIVFKNAVQESGNKGKSVVSAVKDIFDPVHNIVEGSQIKNAFREHAATYRHNSDLAAETSNIRSKVWDKVKPEDRLNFIHSIETGTPQKGTEDLYKGYRELFDKDYETMKQIDPNSPYRKDYFTHNGLWADPEQANQFFSKWQKESLGGSKSFMKGREFPTIYDGLKAGLKIKETNPEKLFLNNHTNVLRAKMADDFMKEMTAKGMPEGAVQAVIDRYMDRGIKGNAIYQTAKTANNALNSFQLGLSLFHASTETMEASVSQMAQGVKEITQGRVKTGLKSVVQSPIAVFKDYYVGNKIMKDAFSANPQFKQDIEYVLEGGGTFRRSKLYDIGQAKKMVENFREGGIKNYAKGILRAPMAALEKLAAPLMENAVPRVKVGSFLSLAHSEMERLGPNASKEVRRQVLSKAWDSIDNRFGELVQDNLLWNQTFKDVMNISTRSLGWNLGTVREIGGGVVDTLKPSTWKGVANGEGITNRMAYTLALPVVTAAVATMYMKMHGQTPSEPLDLAYPKTGEKTKQGYDERVSIPGYMKDVFAYKENTPQTILNKQSPIFTVASKLGELGLTGGIKDYYGNWVVDPYATDKEKSLQIAKWAVSQATPFSVSGSKQRVDQSTQAKAESVFGFNPAPAHITKGSDVTELNQLWRDMLPSVPKTPAESKAFDEKMKNMDATVGKTPEEAKKEMDFLLELRKTGNDTPERTDLINNYYETLTEKQRKSLNFKMMMAGISTKGTSMSDEVIKGKPIYEKWKKAFDAKDLEAARAAYPKNSEDLKAFKAAETSFKTAQSKKTTTKYSDIIDKAVELRKAGRGQEVAALIADLTPEEKKAVINSITAKLR